VLWGRLVVCVAPHVRRCSRPRGGWLAQSVFCGGNDGACQGFFDMPPVFASGRLPSAWVGYIRWPPRPRCWRPNLPEWWVCGGSHLCVGKLRGGVYEGNSKIMECLPAPKVFVERVGKNFAHPEGGEPRVFSEESCLKETGPQSPECVPAKGAEIGRWKGFPRVPSRVSPGACKPGNCKGGPVVVVKVFDKTLDKGSGGKSNQRVVVPPHPRVCVPMLPPIGPS